MLTATITEIKGGLSHNVTPRECDSTLDIRIPVGTNCKSVEEKISKAVNEISKERQVEAFYSIIDETEPFEAEHNSPLVRALTCLLYTSPSPRDATLSRMPSSA